MKRVFLGVLLIYVSQAGALPVNNLQADSLVQQVAEGLNPARPPAALSDAWQSTFLLLFVNKEGARVGSAFVVAREINGTEQTLDLLTADHVLSGYCDQITCANLQVFDNGIIKTDGAKDWRRATRALPSPNVRVVARNPRDDLALIRITTSATLDVKPLTFADAEAGTGESVFAIGYPKVFVRKNATDLDPNIIQRRWSEGLVMGVQNYGRLLAGEYLTTDADALPGNSGGPVVNAAGEVIGVLGLSGGVAATSFEYIASHYGANEGIQGAAIRLARVKAFLNWVH